MPSISKSSPIDYSSLYQERALLWAQDVNQKFGRSAYALAGAALGGLAGFGANFGAEILEWSAQKAGQIVGEVRELTTYF